MKLTFHDIWHAAMDQRRAGFTAKRELIRVTPGDCIEIDYRAAHVMVEAHVELFPGVVNHYNTQPIPHPLDLLPRDGDEHDDDYMERLYIDARAWPEVYFDFGPMEGASHG